MEELNYELENPRLILTQQFIYKDDHNIKYVFVEEYNLNKKLILGEGQGMEWVDFLELSGLKIVDHDIEVLEYIKDKY